MGQSLRILSANLWNGRAHAEAFVDLVHSLEVDAVAVQELSPAQADALSGALPYGHLAPGNRHEGMGILLREPGEVKALPLFRRGGLQVTLQPEHWPGLTREVDLVNLHLIAPQVMIPVPGLIARRRQGRDLDAFLADTGHRAQVLVGDFNATPWWPLYHVPARHLEDAAVAVAQRLGRTAARTWGPRPWAPRMLRIDHGFVRGLEAESFEVLPVRDGDHSAIVLEARPQPQEDLA